MEGIEGRLTAVLHKSLQANGIFPNGGELAQLAKDVAEFIAKETGEVLEPKATVPPPAPPVPPSAHQPKIQHPVSE